MKKRLGLVLIILVLISATMTKYVYAEENAVIKKINEHIKIEDVQEHAEESGKETTEQVFTEGTANVEPDKRRF